MGYILKAKDSRRQLSSPMQVIAVDITEQLPKSEAGNRYILIVGDYFIKLAEAYAILDQ